MSRPQKSKEPVKKPWAGNEQPRNPQSKFQSQYKERRGEAIALRLPLSVDEKVRAAANWQDKADNPKLKAWIEAAIREKLARDEPESSD